MSHTMHEIRAAADRLLRQCEDLSDTETGTVLIIAMTRMGVASGFGADELPETLAELMLSAVAALQSETPQS